jgi:anti-anti-sigma factor
MSQTSVLTRPTAGGNTASPFLCSWQTGGSGAAWVHVAGELDPASSPQLEEALAEAQLAARMVVLDLRELTSIDISGVHVIRDAADRARRRWGRLMLVRGPAEVDRELTLSGASDEMLIFELDSTEPARTLLDVD